MSLSRAQHGLYPRLWRGVCAARGTDPKDEAARLEMHAGLGLPASRTRWGNEEFTIWKRECLAISEPANLQAQMDGLDQGRIQRRYRVRQLLGELGRDERDLPAVVGRINRAVRVWPKGQEERQQGQITRPFEMMDEGELDRVIMELRRDRRGERGQGWMGAVVGAVVVTGSQGHGTVRGPVAEEDVPF